MRVLILSDNQLFGQAADIFIDSARKAVDERGRFTVALSGGSTPRTLYELLAGDYAKEVPWDRTLVFFSDERCVPSDEPASNFGMAFRTLLDRVPIPSDNIHPIIGELAPETAAEKYSAEIVDTFDLEEHEFPAFDLILLGMGEEGHTASIFPGSTALNEKSDLVEAVYVEKLGVDRITLTPPILTNARRVLILVTGESKARALQQVLHGEYVPEEYPAQLLRNAGGEVIWLVDPAAASRLGT